MSEQRKVPKLRFPEFTDDWEQHKLNEITSRVQGNNGRLNLQTLTISAGNGWMKQEDRFSANIAGKEQKNYTLLKQGELAYNHGNSKLAKYGAVFELKDFDEALVPRVYHSFRVNNKTNSSFIEYLFATKILDKELGKLVSSGARMDGLLNIGYEDFVSIKITVPSFEEQQKIASYFRKVDEIITLHQRKCEVLKKLKKGLLQKMFPKDGTNIPEIRFPEFTDAWERRKLGDGMTEYTDRVYIEDSEIYNQVSVKNIGEICLRGQQLGANIGRKRQAKVNLDTHPNTLIFTRQTIEQGGIGFAPEETNGAIVTENMPTIDVNTEIFDKDFFMAFTKTISFRKQVILPNIDGGTAQVAIHEDDVLTSEIEVPSIDEQKKIGEYFSNIDNLITLHQRKLEVLKKLKKGLLQQMFV